MRNDIISQCLHNTNSTMAECSTDVRSSPEKIARPFVKSHETNGTSVPLETSPQKQLEKDKLLAEELEEKISLLTMKEESQQLTTEKGKSSPTPQIIVSPPGDRQTKPLLQQQQKVSFRPLTEADVTDIWDTTQGVLKQLTPHRLMLIGTHNNSKCISSFNKLLRTYCHYKTNDIEYALAMVHAKTSDYLIAGNSRVGRITVNELPYIVEDNDNGSSSSSSCTWSSASASASTSTSTLTAVEGSSTTLLPPPESVFDVEDLIVKEIEKNEYVDSICLVIDGLAEYKSISSSLQYFLNKVSEVLTEPIQDNFVVLFTGVKDISELKFDITNIAKHLGVIREFCIESPCWLKSETRETLEAVHMSLFPTYEHSNIVFDFKKAIPVLEEFVLSITRFDPIFTRDFTRLYRNKEEFEERFLMNLTLYLHSFNTVRSLERLKVAIYDAIKQYAPAEQMPEETKRNIQIEKEVTELVKDYNIKADSRKLLVKDIYYNTICIYPGCRLNCHLRCTDVKRPIFKHTGLMECSRLDEFNDIDDDNICKHCGHGYQYHYHNTVRYEVTPSTNVKFNRWEASDRGFQADVYRVLEDIDKLKAEGRKTTESCIGAISILLDAGNWSTGTDCPDMIPLGRSHHHQSIFWLQNALCVIQKYTDCSRDPKHVVNWQGLMSKCLVTLTKKNASNV